MTQPPDYASKRRICAVCGHTLDYYGWDDGSPGLGWDHTPYDKTLGNADHPAIPVLPGEVPDEGRCDFCLTGHPTYVVPAEDFQVDPGHMSHGDWAACPECGILVQAKQWNTLVYRVWSLSPFRDEMPKAMLMFGFKKLYADLEKHITGELIPIKEA